MISGGETLEFFVGSLLLLGACVCRGIENNCTGKLSAEDPLQVVVVKGIFSGIGSLLTAMMIGENIPFGGAAISLMLYRQAPSVVFLCALAVMIAGTILPSENQSAFDR